MECNAPTDHGVGATGIYWCWGKGVSPGKQQKECGGKCLLVCEPHEAPVAQLILPAETRAPCLCTQGWRSGRNCLDMSVKTHTLIQLLMFVCSDRLHTFTLFFPLAVCHR